jgi:hypothetical protein
MPRLHALELLPDADGDEAVRLDWEALRDAELPSMLDHAGATNTPHVTVLALPDIGPALEVRACDLLGDLLPAVVRASGIVVLGGERVTLARLLDVPPDLTRAVLELHGAAAGEHHAGWLPHLTLARRVPRGEVQRAVDVLGYADRTITLVRLRRWDPERREVRILGEG